MTEKTVMQNARIAQNQEEYQRHYEGIVARYDAANAQLDEVTEAVSAKEAQSDWHCSSSDSRNRAHL